MKKISIAIDGPAAAGKSTAAKIIAERLGYIYIDTGAMYRGLTYKALQKNIDIHNGKECFQLLLDTSIKLEPSDQGQLVFVDGENVTSEIRSQEVTNHVSIVAKHKEVREEMVKRQKLLAKNGGVVMDGRDIGTHVIPHAEVKIFLLASVEERAIRRYKENQAKGINTSLETLKEEIANRDKQDMEREVAPLKKAEDAVEIDTTSKTIEEVVEEIIRLAKERIE